MKCLTVDVASVVWDLFLLDGEVRDLERSGYGYGGVYARREEQMGRMRSSTYVIQSCLVVVYGRVQLAG